MTYFSRNWSSSTTNGPGVVGRAAASGATDGRRPPGFAEPTIVCSVPDGKRLREPDAVSSTAHGPRTACWMACTRRRRSAPRDMLLVAVAAILFRLGGFAQAASVGLVSTGAALGQLDARPAAPVYVPPRHDGALHASALGAFTSRSRRKADRRQRQGRCHRGASLRRGVRRGRDLARRQSRLREHEDDVPAALVRCW